ncbi:MAG: hypothetical protein JNN01_21340 [Opitutaceae bacterium]|nr:hypothetical protein [Opitutaceae bacterium]
MSCCPLFLAVTAGPAPSPAVDVSTALLVIALGLLVFVAKAVADLRAEVADLREQLVRLPPAAISSPAPSQAPALDDDLDATTCALIAAAVRVALAGQEHRIVAIAPPSRDAGWSLEGRRQVFQSHQVR